MTMNPMENYIAAVRFQNPERVPLGNEDVSCSFQLEGNFCCANWTDQWGVQWEVGIEGTVPFPKGNPLPSLDHLADYRPPEPSDLVLTAEARNTIDRTDRNTRLLVGCHTYLLFERAWAIMGMENFLASLITHPAQMHEFLDIIAGYARQVFDRYLELGVDVITFSEDLGTQRALTMSPAMFREFILPRYVRIFDNALRAGKIVHFHSCGCVHDIAADIAAIGDGHPGALMLNPVQARANDLARIKAETIGRMALNGAIDTALLAGGTPAQVRAEVVRVMEILKPGGGYICAPDQGIPGIPDENMTALWKTAGEVGKY